MPENHEIRMAEINNAKNFILQDDSLSVEKKIRLMEMAVNLFKIALTELQHET